ncbi:uncharacterized protein LOC111260423 [Varroa jacobsoni]|uniref:uncharacterized protein LOC111260423 n=1 Tax=Varroa jacobsoni TaxID=62625 RepID=UPI000BF25515|nr:uncharacterized protein LOC111260423 [Varroa jacobsoni]
MSPPPVTSRTKKQQQQQQQPPHHHQQQSGAVVLRHVRVQRVGSERRPAPKSHQPVASGHPTVVTMPQGSSQSVDLPHSAAITVVPTSMVTIHPTKMHQFSTDLIATGRQFQLNQPIITEAGEEFHVNPDSEEIGSLRTAPEYFLVDSGRVSPRQISSSSGNETSCSVSAQQSRILVEDQPCP